MTVKNSTLKPNRLDLDLSDAEAPRQAVFAARSVRIPSALLARERPLATPNADLRAAIDLHMPYRSYRTRMPFDTPPCAHNGDLTFQGRGGHSE